MRIGKYLDSVSELKRFKTDKELAAWLEVTPAAVSQYRSGARTMDNEKCVKLALELNIDPLKIIMATDMDKAERAGQHSLWEVFTARMATAASVLLALLVAASVNLFLTPKNAEAAPRLASQHVAQAEDFILCKMRQALHAVRTWFKRRFSGPALVPATP